MSAAADPATVPAAGPVAAAYDARVAAGAIADDAAQRALLPHLDRVVRDLAATPPSTAAGGGWLGRLFGGGPATAAAPRGVYLWGGVGRGKSMLMDLVTEVAARPDSRRVHFHAFMQEVQAGLAEARRAGHQDAVRPVAEGIAAQTRLFCFDEMQITDIADAMIVGRLFQILFERGVVIVTTSNRPPEDLYKNGLNRELFLPFIALLRQRMEVVELASARDHRRNRLQGRPVWHVPADARAAAALDADWDLLTGGAAPTPATFEVMGRTLEFPAFHEGVARASFWDLCGRPLGPADYLEVARRADVLLIDGIPRLSASNFNEARRFVTLIDALYEAKTRLVASAADRPDALYIEGEGAFEFARTASRLMEMQAEGWGRDREAAGGA